MTFNQIECFVECAKTLNFTKAAENLYISQQTMSRQIHALEKELGFPVFERKNTGVRLTPCGESLYADWKEWPEKYRSSVDRASDIYRGEGKNIRIGVSDMGNRVSAVSRALLDFNEKYPDLSVEYVVDSYPRMREELEEGRLHMLITFGVEILNEKDWNVIRISHSAFRVGIVMGRNYPLAVKENVAIEDIEYEPIAVLSERLSVDHKQRVTEWFRERGIRHPLNLKEYDSFSNVQIALATGKCVGVIYERIMDGMEDKLRFYPIEEQEHVGKEIVIAWENDRYARKAKNISEILEKRLAGTMGL